MQVQQREATSQFTNGNIQLDRKCSKEKGRTLEQTQKAHQTTYQCSNMDLEGAQRISQTPRIFM